MKTSIKELDKFQRRARFKNRWITPWRLFKQDGDKSVIMLWFLAILALNLVLTIPVVLIVPETPLGWSLATGILLPAHIYTVYFMLWAETEDRNLESCARKELEKNLPKVECLTLRRFQDYTSDPAHLAELYVDEKFSTARLQLTTQITKTSETLDTLRSMPNRFRDTVYTQKLIDNLQDQKDAMRRKLDEVNTAQNSFGSQISSQLVQMVAGEQLRQIIRGSELFIKNRVLLQEIEDSLCQLRQTCSELCSRQQDLEVESSALTQTVHELGTVYTQVAQK